MASVTPTDKLRAKFKTPSLSTFHAKRAQPDTATGTDGDAYGGRRSPSKHRRVAEEKDANINDDGSDVDECMPMSSAQLDRYSASGSRTAKTAEGQSVEPRRALNARLERFEMERRAAAARAAKDSLGSLQQSSSSSDPSATYFLCLYRSPQARKHKSWDGDGYLKVSSAGGCRLYDLGSRRL